MGANSFPTRRVAHPPRGSARRRDEGAALDAIRRIVRVLRVSARDIEQRTGLSSAQLFVLQQLAESPAESVNELADRTLTDQSSVSVVVTRLADRGLVLRTPSVTDARRTTVTITRAGRAALRAAPEPPQRRLVAALQALPERALRSLTRDLNALVSAMSASDEPATLLFEDDSTRRSP